MDFLVIPDLTTSPELYPPSVPFTFPLDPFQKHAISAIHQGHNVLVCAKTGSGKTLVGEYQIHHSLAQHKRIFYTTPIKSLSNQKFSDLKALYPTASVGIMTGDIKFQPDAQILVMTTEILQNLLFKQHTATQSLGLTASLTLDNLGSIIFDECHYINDPDRGKVWEQTMILAPQTVQLVLLSATLEKPERFAQWLGSLKKIPCHLIQTQYRIVPLTHAVLDLHDNQIVTMTPGTELYQDAAYRGWLQERKDLVEDHRHFQEKVHAKVVSGDKGAVEGKVRPKSFVHQLNHTLGLLQHRNQLPALFFVFSRKGCETLASKVSHTFLDGGESSSVDHLIKYHLHSYKSLEVLPQYHELRALLLKGIAFHHSGLLPLLKEIVEILFLKGLVRLLFATETFAVGLNMPTKTVVFTSLQKYDDHVQGLRLLRTDEYTQMAGRAGRRGKDAEGLVLYMPEREPVSSFELHQIMKGSRQPVTSRMVFQYDFLLKTLLWDNTSWLTLMCQSYWFEQRKALKERTSLDRTALEIRLSALEVRIRPEDIATYEKKKRMEQEMRTTTQNKRKKLQQELASQKATYDSPAFREASVLYEDLQRLRTEHMDLCKYQASLEAHATLLDEPVAFLMDRDYLKKSDKAATDLTKEDLTLKGMLATEVNEGHPILMTDLFVSKRAHGLSGPCLATLLSTFLEDYDKDAIVYVPGVPTEVQALLKSLTEESKDSGSISTQWAELVFRWTTEETPLAALCADYRTFEGNVARGFLKLSNILEEWLSMATFCNEADQIEKITALKPILIRDVVMPNSLYLRI